MLSVNDDVSSVANFSVDCCSDSILSGDNVDESNFDEIFFSFRGFISSKCNDGVGSGSRTWDRERDLDRDLDRYVGRLSLSTVGSDSSTTTIVDTCVVVLAIVVCGISTFSNGTIGDCSVLSLESSARSTTDDHVVVNVVVVGGAKLSSSSLSTMSAHEVFFITSSVNTD